MHKFVEHPVTIEQKKAFGCKILDARFAPEGEKTYSADGKDLSKPKRKPKEKKASE